MTTVTQNIIFDSKEAGGPARFTFTCDRCRKPVSVTARVLPGNPDVDFAVQVCQCMHDDVNHLRDEIREYEVEQEFFLMVNKMLMKDVRQAEEVADALEKLIKAPRREAAEILKAWRERGKEPDTTNGDWLESKQLEEQVKAMSAWLHNELNMPGQPWPEEDSDE